MEEGREGLAYTLLVREMEREYVVARLPLSSAEERSAVPGQLVMAEQAAGEQELAAVAAAPALSGEVAAAPEFSEDLAASPALSGTTSMHPHGVP